MSDTPRTDAETGYFELNKREVNYRNEPYVKTEFARVLERELAAEREKAERYRLVTLKQDAELSALREDKERLDWLEANLYTLWASGLRCNESPAVEIAACSGRFEAESIRAAIDAARAKEAQP